MKIKDIKDIIFFLTIGWIAVWLINHGQDKANENMDEMDEWTPEPDSKKFEKPKKQNNTY